MSDAAGTVETALLLNLFLQIGNAPLRLYDTQAILGERRNTRGVIAAVLKAVKPLNQNRQRVFTPCKSNDSTHKTNSSEQKG